MSIDVRDLSFAYGKRQVLRQVSFRTRPGQLVAVLGPNGAGKSTLFRCILGFLPRYRGRSPCADTICAPWTAAAWPGWRRISPSPAPRCIITPSGTRC